ncbi:hypothetical protein GKG10_27745 [Escherichia coli]|nr:hypothetical protein [Escherichia coli]
MATYHLSVKFGGKGQAANHADYIERKEKYRDRQDLEYSAHGNMPEWARDNPSHFWQAADQFERANGSTYRELEIALPRELTPEQRLELVAKGEAYDDKRFMALCMLENGYSQKAIAAMLEVSTRTIRNWKSGK